MYIKQLMCFFMLAVGIAFSSASHAGFWDKFKAAICPSGNEPGDYSWCDTLKHLTNPPGADNPVTPAQREGLYPLLSNPSNFEDGWDPKKHYIWQTVQLHPDTGAICGNGSPYKFFVNRVPNTSNTVIYMEGGGACWDYESCTGQTGIRGARNPNGVPDDYMSILNPSSSLVSPFVFRLHPWTRTKTQNWNMVYVPYCTGDIYAGDRTTIYEDPNGEGDPLVWHHNGLKNTRAITAWLKDNLPKPTQMLNTGCSAGGTGSLANYFPLRRDIAPNKSFLINDSGPIFTAPAGSDPADYPSIKLHNQIKEAWGLYDGYDSPLAYIERELPGFDASDLGTLMKSLAVNYANDRMGQTHFWDDGNYSGYSYERFYDDIINAPDPETAKMRVRMRWHQDTERMKSDLQPYDNFGYYLPRYRNLNDSHCSTIVDFNHGDIQEAGLELSDFVDNVLDGSGSVMQASETDTQADYDKPKNLIYELLNQLL